MKRKLTPEFINAQPVPASSLRCLQYRPAGMDLFWLSRGACALNVISTGTTGSGKTFDMLAVLNRVAQAEPRGSLMPNDARGMFSNAAPHPLRYLQHIKKGRVS
ncbi:hypothetical protein [Rahnella aceris]|jgi:hypothetical protein